MKHSTRKFLIIFSCFLIFSAASVGIIKPVYDTITQKLVEVEQKFMDTFYEKTGLSLSYRSISPSILTGLTLRGVKVYAKDSGDEILSIKKVSVGYSLKSIFKKDFAHAFNNLVIYNVNFDYAGEKYPEVQEKLLALVNLDMENQIEFSDELMENIKNTLFMLPFSVQVRNIKAHFVSGQNDVSANLNKLAISKDSSAVAITMDLTGEFFAKLEALKGQSLGLKFNMDAKILQRMKDSSFFLSLDTHPRADYSLAKMEYLLRYGDEVFYINTIQQALPYDFSIRYDNKNSQADIQISTQNLNPFSLVKMPPLGAPLNKFYGSRLTLDGKFGVNLKTMDYNWNALGSVSLPRSLIPEGEVVSLNARGNNTDIVINSLKATGALFGASLNGTFNIPRLDPSITMQLDYFTLPNGNQISADLYLEMQKDKYVAFIPQLYLGEKTFTAIQAEAGIKNQQVDFSLSLSDYSHYEYSSPAEISLEGVFQMGSSQYVQAILDVRNLFADSVCDAIIYCLPPESAQSIIDLKPKLAPFIASTELYVSSDLKSITYNSPYTVIANTEQARQALLLSFDGTDSSVNVSQLELLFNDFTVQANVNADISLEDKQIIFSTDFNLNSIPYHLDGAFTNGNWLNITGNYGLDIMVNIGKTLYGSIEFSSLPLSYGDFLFYTSMRADFNYELEGKPFLENQFEVNIEGLELHEESGKIAFNPKFSLAAVMNNDALELSSLSYADNTSSMFGSGLVDWQNQGSAISQIDLNIKMENPLSDERITIQGLVKNEKDLENFTFKDLLEAKLSLTMDIQEISMARFQSNQYEDDVLNAFIRADGTVKNPSVALNLQKFRMNLNGSPFNAGGVAQFEIVDDQHWNLDLTGLYAYYNSIELTDLRGKMNLKSFNGEFNTSAYMGFGGKDLKMPLKVNIANLSPQSTGFIPEMFKVSLDCPAVTGSLLNDKIPVYLEAVRMKGMWTFTSGENLGISGYYTDNGNVSLRVNNKKPLHFALSGNVDVKKSRMDLKVSDFYFNAAHFSKYFNSNYFSLYSGQISGNLELAGIFSDPNIDGSINVMNLDFNMPDLIPEHFTSKSFTVNMTQDGIHLNDCLFYIKGTELSVDSQILLERWKLDSLELRAKTDGVNGIPVDAKVPLVSATGNLGIDVLMSYSGDDVDVQGNVTLENSKITVLDMSKLGSLKKDDKVEKKKPQQKSPIDINADLTLTFGQKVQFIVNPILRTLVAPGTPVNITMNTAENLWTVKGDVTLRGGEVTYLNRNFYLKEGRIIMDENQDVFDPNITVRAETREHDEQGENVTITLSAIRQNASNFNPSLYSTPAKSLNEIYQLLGQAAAGDTDSVGGLLISTIDYGVQVTVLRRLENALRDLFNFDIFSIRTAVLQNAIKQGLNMDSSDTKAYSIGNYFDNSTVYIGKYFGESVYVDAMMNWAYDELAAESGDSATGLVFQPEIGLELSSPIANIRWSFAPDITDLQNSLISANSITLSWRLTF